MVVEWAFSGIWAWRAVRVSPIYPTYITSIEKFTYISALGGTKVSWTRSRFNTNVEKRFSGDQCLNSWLIHGSYCTILAMMRWIRSRFSVTSDQSSRNMVQSEARRVRNDEVLACHCMLTGWSSFASRNEGPLRSSRFIGWESTRIWYWVLLLRFSPAALPLLLFFIFVVASSELHNCIFMPHNSAAIQPPLQ